MTGTRRIPRRPRQHGRTGWLLGRVMVLAGSWLACLTATAVPGSAAAWTDANVRRVHAHVEVRPDGRARVSMRLWVRVHAGWLEGLEIAGLDEDFELDRSKPPWAVSADDPDLKYAPTVRTRGTGRLQLSFHGRGKSPRQGTVRIGLVYHTDLALRATVHRPDDTIRVQWTLPPWRSGLDGASVAFTLPAGATPVEAGDEDRSIHFEAHRTARSTVLHWDRVHLPRTMPWTLSADVPEEAMDAALRTLQDPDAPAPASVADATPSRRSGTALALALLALSLISGWLFRRNCARAGVRRRPLVPCPEPVRVLLLTGCAALGILWWPDRGHLALLLLAGIPILSLERTPVFTGGIPKLGAWRPVDVADRLVARRATWSRGLGVTALVDPTSITGWIVLAGTAGLVWLAAAPAEGPDRTLLLEGLGLLPLLFVSRSRLHLPTTVPVRLHQLLRVARRMRPTPDPVAPFGIRPFLHVDGEGRWQEARLRIEPCRRPARLLRLDLALSDRRLLGGFARELTLLAVCREGTVTDVALSQALPEAKTQRAPGGRVARTVPLRLDELGATLTPVLDALADALEGELAGADEELSPSRRTPDAREAA